MGMRNRNCLDYLYFIYCTAHIVLHFLLVNPMLFYFVFFPFRQALVAWVKPLSSHLHPCARLVPHLALAPPRREARSS